MFEHKKGATFSLGGAIVDVGGEPLPDFTTWSGTCQIRMLNDTLVDNIEVVWLDRPQGLIKLYKKDTSSWATGVAEIDVKFTLTDTEEKVYSKTQPILIVKGVTHA